MAGGRKRLFDLQFDGVDLIRNVDQLNFGSSFDVVPDPGFDNRRALLEVISAVAIRDVTFAESEAEDQTTSTTFAEKVSAEFDTIVADRTYLVICYCECSSDQNEFGIDLRLHLNDSEVLGLVRDYQPGNATGYGSMMMFDQISPGIGSHYIDLDYAANTTNKNVRIRRGRIWLLQYISND